MRSATVQPTHRFRVLLCFGIAVFLLALQFAQPFQFNFQYTARIIASENRFEQLQSSKAGNLAIQIRLEPTPQDLLAETPLGLQRTATVPDLKVQQIRCVCNDRQTAKHLSQFILDRSVTRYPLRDEAVQKSARLNRWHIESLQHQLRCMKQQSDNEQKNKTLLTASLNDGERSMETGSPFRTVSLQRDRPRADIRNKTQQELSERVAMNRVIENRKSQFQTISTGILSQSTPWHLEVAAERTERSRLLLCLCASWLAATIAALLPRFNPILSQHIHRRANPLKIYQRTLAQLQIHDFGIVGLSQAPSSKPSPINVALWVRYEPTIYRVSEWIIVLSFACSAARFVFDPAWRSLFFDSPLAALSRCTLGV